MLIFNILDLSHNFVIQMYGITMNIEQILLHFLETDIIKIQILG